MSNHSRRLRREALTALALLGMAVALSADRPAAASQREVVIVVPFPNAERETRIWAEQEEGIDFRRHAELAARCTTAFAATELADHLLQTLTDTTITFAPVRPKDKTSILSRFLRWNGHKPSQAMPIPAHLVDAAQAARSGREAVEKLNAALEILASLRRRAEFQPPYELRIGEDGRALRYGRDTIELMSLLVQYHEALRLDRADEANNLWRRIEHVSAVMDGYWVPIGYAGKGRAGLESRDALTRSQLRGLVGRCRQYRINNRLPVHP